MQVLVARLIMPDRQQYKAASFCCHLLVGNYPDKAGGWLARKCIRSRRTCVLFRGVSGYHLPTRYPPRMPAFAFTIRKTCMQAHIPIRRPACLLAIGLSLLFQSVPAAEWPVIEQQARGQTVYFNAWGGAENINRYIDWAAAQVRERFGVTVEHVKINDAAEVVKRIQTEQEAGRTRNGSVDLIWVNGENFSTLKRQSLLYGPWAETLPNWQYVDTEKPVRQDFSETTDGLEAPWGTAQLTFIADRTRVPKPPVSARALLDFARQHPGRVSYPRPPDFHGTTFLKQLLLSLGTDPLVLREPVRTADFASVTRPLWDYLDQLHPLAWRAGKAFPASSAEMHQKLADGELLLSLSFNPNEGASLVASGQLPETTYSFGFSDGTIGNVHFVAIPFNASAPEAAQVFANFLLSPEAQRRKADITVWGDPSVLAADSLPEADREALNATATGALADPVPTLPEPHASWVDALEQEWLQRYGS